MAEQYVLEIGPGIGTMTQYLCEKARQVVAVEVDQKLILVLEETLSGNDNVMVLNEDVLKVDIIMGLFEAHVLILSRLVDTFTSRISYLMLLLSGNHSIAVV